MPFLSFAYETPLSICREEAQSQVGGVFNHMQVDFIHAPGSSISKCTTVDTSYLYLPMSLRVLVPLVPMQSM
jgi:hypothetical protein